MCLKLSTPSTQPFSAQAEALSQLSNEELNTALVAQTAPLDACLELLAPPSPPHHHQRFQGLSSSALVGLQRRPPGSPDPFVDFDYVESFQVGRESNVDGLCKRG